MNVLPPHIFPSVGWFIQGIRDGGFHVAMGGFYRKQEWQNRYSIAGPNKLQDLIIPVVHTGSAKYLADTRISRLSKWSREHKNALKSAYGKAPFFEFYDYRVFEILELADDLLPVWIENSIRLLHKNLGMELPLSFSDAECRQISLPVPPEYPQVFEEKFGFRYPVSALDLLFNLGPEAGDYLMDAASGRR